MPASANVFIRARPVIDSIIGLGDIDAALARMEARNVFGKIIVTL